MPKAARANPLLLVTAALLVLSPTCAAASSRYPQALENGVGLASEPDCTLCHRTSRGGPNTATKPFARNLVALGLEDGGNVASLQAAILAAEEENSDSDGAGSPDLDELALGTDPNDAADDLAETTTRSGTWFESQDAGVSAIHATCSTGDGAVVRSSTRGAWPLLLVLVAGVALSRRAQRASSRRADAPRRSARSAWLRRERG